MGDMILFLLFWGLILLGIPMLIYLSTKMAAAGWFRGKRMAEKETESENQGER